MNDIGFSREGAAFTPMGSSGAPVAADQPPSVLKKYAIVLVRWKWLIVGAIAAALVIGLIVTLLMTPLYTSTTRIEISREGAQIVNVDGVEPETPATDLEFYQTQYGVLSSRTMAERVVRELKLDQNANFFEHFGEDDIASGLTKTGANAPEGGREMRVRVAVDILQDNVEIAPIRMSRLVDIAWTSPDPALSTRVANAWAASFIQYNLERRYGATAYARKFLEERLEQLRQRLEQSERQLVGYASNQAIINIPVPGVGADGRSQERSLTADSLALLNSELAQAQAARAQAQSRLQGQGGGASAEALTNQAITSLRQRRGEVAAEYARLMTQFEPAYPPAQALAAQLQQLDRSIAREEGRVRQSLQNAYQDSLRREQVISGQVEGLKQDFLDQRRRGIQYNIYQREADTNRELYDGLLQRYKEIGIGGVGENNIAIVDRARVPDRPSQPRPLLNMLLALFAGTLAGVALAFAREQIDETVRDPSEVERMIGLPLLGTIPKSESPDILADVHDPKSDILEAYLSVQTNLRFSTDHGIPKSLTVTSTRPAEGKSTTAYAIAYSIARNGAKIILVDGDMRSPSLHQELGITNEKGLSNYLSGTEALDQIIRQPEQVAFFAMTSGPQPPNAAELLRGDRLDALLAELLTRFDHVVIDSPPVMGLADAPLIASRTEGTVLVIEAQSVKANNAKLAMARLRQARAKLLGTVLTKFEAKKAHFGYGYDYGYGYGEKADAKG